ncbi:hypothetical protein ACFQ1M_07625 [Sungkyunkwania multivorans]|uniref:Uncharacterized protein n=1 Tax=Sungkyunkwania multivorans TaxID=1173618 RepID=A0ABW3CWP7_9FLAO
MKEFMCINYGNRISNEDSHIFEILDGLRFKITTLFLNSFPATG